MTDAHDTLYVADLAAILRCSPRTILRNIHKAGGREPWNLPPRMLAVDRRHRWSRVIVEAWLAHNPHASRLRRAG